MSGYDAPCLGNFLMGIPVAYKTTLLQDNNSDGIWDHSEVHNVIVDYFNQIENERIIYDYGADGVIDTNIWIDPTYSESHHHLKQAEYTAYDFNGDGVAEQHRWTELLRDASGRLLHEDIYSEDLDLDGMPDYSTMKEISYTASGQVSQNLTRSYINGSESPADYRLETFVYSTSGLLTEITIDDAASLDFEIGFKFAYNAAGQVTREWIRDEFVFNDNNWHNEATYKYSNGRLVEANKYAEYFNGTNVLEVKTKLSYDGVGNLKKEVATGSDYNWQPVERVQTEYWRDTQGRETHKLISFDEDMNGTYDPGTRTLVVTQYNADGDVSYKATDFNTGDGVIEELFTLEPYDPLLA